MSLTTREIRQTFLQFFEKKSHAIVPSAPIVLKDDPTLMFTNAGMNQFKGVFVGNEDAKEKRVADTQKCLRVSGKHNDLEEVGRDHYHHTMFEMLGNWSFGDYFKEEAIAYAWELLVDVFKLDPDCMYVSVFAGDDELGLGSDEEAVAIWKQHVAEDRILHFGRKDNFWEMGETGPCGPCSEIHYDMRSADDRAKIDGRELVNQDDPEVIEIWNLVFMQFSRQEDGSLNTLKEKHIDTGMGLERLARALQGKTSNYDIDLFATIIQKIEGLTGKEYTGGESRKDIAFRVIADHVRAISFCIADGQLPSNTGAGYVVRRVLRRAIRYGYSELGMGKPFIYQVFEAMKAEMGEDFPELNRNAVLIQKVLQEEEVSFLVTLERGLNRLEQYFKENPSLQEVEGSVAFELYDTYGFPIDLTQLIASEHSKGVDMKGFQAALTEQKDRSRKASKASFGDWTILDDGSNSTFLGYDQLTSDSRVMKFRKATVKGKEVAQLVLDQTPFYVESGGQVGDKGILISGDQKINVFDTKKENNEIIHFVDALPHDPSMTLQAKVAEERREEIKKNHSATHLLHHVLRDVLGTHVEQKGSLVAPDRLRFDFSHFEKIDAATLKRIEADVTEMVDAHIPLQEERSLPIEEAKKRGAIALFGEKYGGKVRVVQFGESIELCGGTHVTNSADIQGFKLVSEGSVASGIRRVEAITGKAYREYLERIEEEYKQINELLGQPKSLLETVQKLQADLKSAQKQIESFEAEQKKGLIDDWRKAFSQVEGCERLIEEVEGVDGKMVKDMVYQLTLEADDRIAVVAGSSDGKPYIVVGISKSLAQAYNLNASNWVRELAQHINGGGGGQPFLAMAGGKNEQGLQRALVHANEIIKI